MITNVVVKCDYCPWSSICSPGVAFERVLCMDPCQVDTGVKGILNLSKNAMEICKIIRVCLTGTRGQCFAFSSSMISGATLSAGLVSLKLSFPPPGGTLTREEVPKSLYQPITMCDKSRLSKSICATPMNTLVPSTLP